MVGTLMSWAVLGLSALGLALPAPAPVADASIQERQAFFFPGGVELVFGPGSSIPACFINGIQKDVSACFAILGIIPGGIHPGRSEEEKRQAFFFPGGVELVFGPGSTLPKCFVDGIQKDVSACYAILGIIPGGINPGKREADAVAARSDPYSIVFPGGVTITWGAGSKYPECWIDGIQKKFDSCFVILGASTGGIIPNIPIPGGAIVPDPTVPGGAIIVSP